jgi:hypothetical protein
MNELVGRVWMLAKAAIIGYLAAAVLALSAVVLVSAAAYAMGASSFDIGVGPLPLMSYSHTADGWGFNSEWGLAAVTPIGAIVGLVLALRARRTATV